MPSLHQGCIPPHPLIYTLLSHPLKSAEGIPWSAAGVSLGQKGKINTHVPREMKDECTNPTKPSCLILDLNVICL